jgi:hypothetical protein
VRWLIAAVSTRDYRITELVLGQALPAAAGECVLWTAACFAEITVLLVFAERALSFAVAEGRLRYTFSTMMTFERLRRAL